MRYACQIYDQSHSRTFDMIQTTQNKALRIVNFKQSIEPSERLYQKLKIDKLKNNILSNCLFIFDKLTNNLLKVPSMIDVSKIRPCYNMLFMKPQSSNTTTTF